MLLTVCAFISIAYMAATTIYTLISLIFADRETKNIRIRNYKKGNFLAHYLASFPLFFAAHLKNGAIIGIAVFNAIKSTFRTAILSFDLELLWPFMEKELFFFIAAALYIALTLLNTILFSLSLFSRRVLNYFALKKIKRGDSNVIVLLGYDEKSKDILSSMARNEAYVKGCKEKKTDVLVITEEITDELKEEMYVNRAAYLRADKDTNIAEFLKTHCANFEKRHVSVIIHTPDESKNLKYAFQLAELAAELKEDVEREFNNSDLGIDAYIFDEGNKDSVYRRVSKISGGAVHCLNKYNIIARDFISKYPLTKFLSWQIDTEHAVFKEGTDARVIMIGFGSVNFHLFRAFVQNNQFLVMNSDGEPEKMTVKYHIFDKEAVESEALLADTYMHYEGWFKNLSDDEKKKYFDLPTLPADVSFHQCNVNNGSFCDEFKNYLTTSEKGYNLVVVALGDDVSVLNLAEKLASYTKEIKAEKNTSFFVRMREPISTMESCFNLDTQSEIIPFGDTASLYSYQKITLHEADKIAKDRHLCYAIESKKETVSDESAKRDALLRWHFQWKNIQRESNVYACLSLRTKLHLLGYEIVEKTEGGPDDSKSFFEDYGHGNKIVYRDKVINQKKLVNYDVEYHKPGTPRTNLAICEHERWNAYHIANGFIPASKEEYRTEGKNALIERRKHINIASTKGLSEYAEWQVSEYGCSPFDADVIKYDYQLMDDAIWLLDRSGYTVVKMKKTKEIEDNK